MSSSIESPSTALIGFTGFVGSNLDRQRTYTRRYNSSNIAAIAGCHFDEVVVSAAKAEKWRINQAPEADLAHIAQLEDVLGSFTAERVVLISTVDVYGTPVDVDENSVIDLQGLHPYGAHRLRLERFIQDRFDETLILRLPGLFGPGLKKNVIFDLLNDNNVDRIHHAGSFQYYDLAHLADDIDRFRGLGLVNVTSTPLRTDELAQKTLGIEFTNVPNGVTPGRYDVRSVHAPQHGYHYQRDDVLADLSAFVAAERTRTDGAA